MRSYNYRVWAAGTLVSNFGTWMQRAAQDWLVLTELTDRPQRDGGRHRDVAAVWAVAATAVPDRLRRRPLRPPQGATSDPERAGPAGAGP